MILNIFTTQKHRDDCVKLFLPESVAQGIKYHILIQSKTLFGVTVQDILEKMIITLMKVHFQGFYVKQEIYIGEKIKGSPSFQLKGKKFSRMCLTRDRTFCMCGKILHKPQLLHADMEIVASIHKIKFISVPGSLLKAIIAPQILDFPLFFFFITI